MKTIKHFSHRELLNYLSPHPPTGLQWRCPLTNNDIIDEEVYGHVPTVSLIVRAARYGHMRTGGVITGVLITELWSWGRVT